MKSHGSDQTKMLPQLEFLKDLYKKELQEVERTREALCAVWMDHTLQYRQSTNHIFNDPKIAVPLQALKEVEDTLRNARSSE